MSFSLPEYLTAQFYAWEKRGRGWEVFDEPVHLEPDFVPFLGHFAPKIHGEIDDGLRPRFFPNLQESLGLFKRKGGNLLRDEALEQLEENYQIEAYLYKQSEGTVELQINFQKDTRVAFDFIEQLILMCGSIQDIVAFEILGTSEKISIQLVCPYSEAIAIHSYINIYAPEVGVTTSTDFLRDSIDYDKELTLNDLGLKHEFVRPLRIWKKFEPDPLSGAIAILDKLEEGEIGLLQILFQKVLNPWAESMNRAVRDSSGDSFFYDDPSMLPLTQEKISSPLFATVIRTVGQSTTLDGAKKISAGLSQSLSSFDRVGSNSLLPLHGNRASCDLDDILERRSRRIGMILNSNELASFVHVPDSSLVSEKLRAYTGKTRLAPKDVVDNSYKIGTNTHLGKKQAVSLSDEHRLRHMHVIGATGVGKSSFIHRLIVNDIQHGRGICVLDPHGDLIDKVITQVPENRLKDVILVDPSDCDYPIGLNLLAATSEAEKIILSSDLVSLFRRFATSWGDQMTSVLANAINAILHCEQGGTLLDLKRFLIEPAFRANILKTVTDPNVVYYWKHEYKLQRRNAVAPILTRLDTFLRSSIIRNMMAQKGGLEFNKILKSNKVLLVKLSQGLIGEENSYLLGTLFVAKLQQAAQERQNLDPEQRQPFYFYIDEFQNFITPSMSALLSGSRKFGLGLILAHQDLEQVYSKDKELANSVLSNPAIRICFRCGDKDAMKLQEGFAHFDANDLQNLSIGHSIVRVGRKDHDFNLSFDLLPVVDKSLAQKRMISIVEKSRTGYAGRREDIEGQLKEILAGFVSENKKRRTLKRNDPTSDIQEKQIAEPIEDAAEDKQFDNEIKSIETKDAEISGAEYIKKEEERRELREHQTIQQFIKNIAQERGFKATIEEEIDNGTGRVDVGISRDDKRIAFEVTVTTSKEHELKNIKKCLNAGYNIVVSCSKDSNHLKTVEEFVISKLVSEDNNNVVFLLANQVANFIDAQTPSTTKSEKPIKGYRTEVTYEEVDKLAKSSLETRISKILHRARTRKNKQK